MTGIGLFTNNAASQLADSIVSTATTIQLVTGGGAKFPTITGSNYFWGTFTDAATQLQTEIVRVTAISGDVLTIVRGQQGTTAQSWSAGDNFYRLITAQDMISAQQAPQVQSGSYNFGVDSGTPNNYVVTLSPALAAYTAGMEITVQISNANTSASVLNAGPGNLNIINPDGTSIGANTLLAAVSGVGGIYTFVCDGNGSAILVSASQSLSGSGLATTGDVKWRPTTETITGWVTGIDGWTIGDAASGSNYANANASALFSWAWTNFSNTQCPIYTSSGAATVRGASAAADFAANCRITLPDMRGIIAGGLDNGTSWYNNVPVTIGNSTTPGSILGEMLHQLVNSELPSITPTFSGTAGNVSVHCSNNIVSANQIVGGLADEGGAFEGFNASGSIINPTSTGTFTPSGTISSFGSNGLHNNTQRTMLGTWYFKL